MSDGRWKMMKRKMEDERRGRREEKRRGQERKERGQVQLEQLPSATSEGLLHPAIQPGTACTPDGRCTPAPNNEIEV
jgi:hypothetical protein